MTIDGSPARPRSPTKGGKMTLDTGERKRLIDQTRKELTDELSKYWSDLKAKLAREGMGQLSDIFGQLKMPRDI